MKKFFTYLKSSFIVIFIAISITGCMRNNDLVPFEIKDNFNIYDFTGTWYEIGSSVNNKDLSNIKINFSIDKNQKIRVVKSGIRQNGKVRKDEYLGRCDSNSSLIEISRYGLFYEPLYIVRNDHYQYAMIYIGDKDISIISRTKTIPEVVRVIYKDKAKSDGFDLSRIEWIKH